MDFSKMSASQLIEPCIPITALAGIAFPAEETISFADPEIAECLEPLDHFLAGCSEVERGVVIEVISEAEDAVRTARDDTLSDSDITGE
jgi:hypothetical protein